MSLLYRVIDASVRAPWWTLLLVALVALLGLRQAQQLRFDAFPDLTDVQVQVVTAAPGLASEEVELLVTVPVERVLAGLPDLVGVRSLSRPGVSSVTARFGPQADPWLARQLVRERLATADVPLGVARPEMAPPSTGLGEVWQFTLTSDRHTRPELYRIFERDVAPRLRTAPGVVEVNAWGAGAPQLHIELDPFALAARGLSLGEVVQRLSGQLGLASGGNLERGRDERTALRAVAQPITAAAVGELALRDSPELVRVRDVGTVREGGALTVGLGTADGEQEALFAMVQLLAGADARGTVAAVRTLADEVRTTLPDGVELAVIYDREDLVGSTLHTVQKSLFEGGLLVILVLLFTLGGVRPGLIVASVIPMSMLGAFAGLALVGASGNLMSLGAVDFGLVVDGSVVIVEGIVALTLVEGVSRHRIFAERAKSVALPVLASSGILFVVYLPILLMQGTEGKLFRPMAVTVLFAVGTALVLAFTWVPALASLLVRPTGHQETRAMRALTAGYRGLGERVFPHPRVAFGLSLAIVLLAVGIATQIGVVFVPRLEEGDLVLQTERPPSISPQAALRETLRTERVLRRFPEVERVATRVGSPAVATDPMGLNEADTLIRLRPRDSWTTADDLDGLIAAMSDAVQAEAPGAALTFTQPIEMRFNELLEGVPSDVGVAVFGPDIDTLLGLGRQIAERLAALPGAADVRAPSVEGALVQSYTVDPARAAALGVDARDVLELVQAVQLGHEVGQVQRGAFRDAVVVKLALPDGVAVEHLPLVLDNGAVVPLASVADATRDDLPAVVRREDGSRRVMVQANVRGRDLGAFVADARDAVSDLELPAGYRLSWVGKLEQLRAAAARTVVTVPLTLALVLLLMRAALGSFGPAWLISLNVPVAISGGVFALALRGLPISMSAIVGFIALFGIAVMNGIVLVARALELLSEHPATEALELAAAERFRPVIVTATVAGLGFIPMALATGVGAEVQRPLATVIIGGLITSTALTLLVLPAVGSWFLPAGAPKPAERAP